MSNLESNSSRQEHYHDDSFWNLPKTDLELDLLNKKYCEIDDFMSMDNVDSILKKHFKTKYRVSTNAKIICDDTVYDSDHHRGYDSDHHRGYVEDTEVWNLVNYTLHKKFPNIMSNLYLNKRFSYIKYGPGSFIDIHLDNDEDALYTVLCYLNDDYCGGETCLCFNDTITIKPKKGKVLLFCGTDIPHFCNPITKNHKYLLAMVICVSKPKKYNIKYFLDYIGCYMHIQRLVFIILYILIITMMIFSAYD